MSSRDSFCKNTKTAFSVICRHLSHGEVLTALRPFYFSVHPDLFGQHPTERAINENSLKQLNAYIEHLQMKRPTTPANLCFYLRSPRKPGTFQEVRVRLAERDLRKTVVDILKSCGLSTSYVDAIPSLTTTPPPPKYTHPRTSQPEPRMWNDIDMTGAGHENDGNSPFIRVRTMQRKIKNAKDSERLIFYDHNIKLEISHLVI
ncbi:hypothetical protein J437_LFUL013406, partial [Ladona fulva]